MTKWTSWRKEKRSIPKILAIPDGYLYVTELFLVGTEEIVTHCHPSWCTQGPHLYSPHHRLLFSLFLFVPSLSSSILAQISLLTNKQAAIQAFLKWIVIYIYKYILKIWIMYILMATNGIMLKMFCYYLHSLSTVWKDVDMLPWIDLLGFF